MELVNNTETPMAGLKQVITNLQQVIELPDFDSAPALSFHCDACGDVGYVFKKVEYRGYMIDNSVMCECRIRRIVPAEYCGVSLESLTPRHDLHPKQAEYIELMRSDPAGKFVLSGDFGTGKTHFFWALYVSALKSRKKTYAGTLRQLIATYQKGIEASQRGEVWIAPICADDFRKNDEPAALFLDDIDKARPTEYTAEIFFDMLDAAVSSQQQIVVTTNLTTDGLLEHFDRADTRFGGAIVRRLLHNAHEINMF